MSPKVRLLHLHRGLRADQNPEQYLQTQYELLRRDALKPLCEAVSSVRMMPESVESSLLITGIGIYEKVLGHHCQRRGIVLISYSGPHLRNLV